MAEDDTPTECGSIPPEILQALGTMVIAWANIEALISHHLAHFLVAHPTPTLMITNGVGAGTQLSWIRTLADIKIGDDATLAEYNELLTQLNELRSERNAYIHGIWISGDLAPTALVQTVKLERAEPIKEELVSAADLEDFAAELVEAASAFRDIGKVLGVRSY